MKTINFSDLNASNVFHPLVSTFFISIHGMNEIFSRLLIRDLKANSKDENDFFQLIDNNPINLPKHTKSELKSFRTFTPLVFSFEAVKKNTLESYYFDIDKCSIDFINFEKIYSNINKLAELLIINAFEIIQSNNPKDNEVLQFFRHIRNAAAHNGKFYFTENVIDKSSNELKMVAKWNGFEIKSNLQDYKLFNTKKTDDDNFWEYGDLIEFLLDLENHFPELKNIVKK